MRAAQECASSEQNHLLLQNTVKVHGQGVVEDGVMGATVSGADEDNWMLEIDSDPEWMSGGGRSDVAFANLSSTESLDFEAAAQQTEETLQVDGEGFDQWGIWRQR